VWWHVSIIPALGSRGRRSSSSRPAWTTYQDPFSKTPENKQMKNTLIELNSIKSEFYCMLITSQLNKLRFLLQLRVSLLL
jgi:hypothetical protein